MGFTKTLLEEMTWDDLDREIEAFVAEQEASYFEQRNQALEELRKETEKTTEFLKSNLKES